jgi:uncharacterized protein (TIGR02001 family)
MQMRASMSRLLRLWLWMSVLPFGTGSAADLEGSLSVSSDNVFRGLTQSQGEASVQADGYAAATHWFGGVSAESVKRLSYESTGAEVIGYFGYRQLLSEDWGVELSARHYDYPGNTYRSRYVYDELSAALNWRQQVLFELIASPDTYAADYQRYGRGSAFAAQLSAHQPLPRGLSADVGGGVYALQQQIGASYAYWSAGVGEQWRTWQFTVRYIGTDAEARHLFGPLAGDRVVASLAWFF